MYRGTLMQLLGQLQVCRKLLILSLWACRVQGFYDEH